MKKVAFLIVFLTFSMTVSAHQPSAKFQTQIATKTLTMENSQMYTSAYYSGNSGILQLIYNVFYKVGNMLSTAGNEEEVPKEELISEN